LSVSQSVFKLVTVEKIIILVWISLIIIKGSPVFVNISILFNAFCVSKELLGNFGWILFREFRIFRLIRVTSDKVKSGKSLVLISVWTNLAGFVEILRIAFICNALLSFCLFSVCSCGF